MSKSCIWKKVYTYIYIYIYLGGGGERKRDISSQVTPDNPKRAGEGTKLVTKNNLAKCIQWSNIKYTKTRQIYLGRDADVKALNCPSMFQKCAAFVSGSAPILTILLPVLEASEGHAWGCCIIASRSPRVSQEHWPSPLPPKRGGQKKEALLRQEGQARKRRNGGHHRGVHKKPASAKRNKSIAGTLDAHESLGRLKVTLASYKSYICCTEPGDLPFFLVELKQSQVGDDHQSLISELALEASEKLLTRQQIKERRAEILQNLTGCLHKSLTRGWGPQRGGLAHERPRNHSWELDYKWPLGPGPLILSVLLHCKQVKLLALAFLEHHCWRSQRLTLYCGAYSSGYCCMGLPPELEMA